MLKTEQPSRRKRGRPHRRFMDVVTRGGLVGVGGRWFLNGAAERRRFSSRKTHTSNSKETCKEITFVCTEWVTSQEKGMRTNAVAWIKSQNHKQLKYTRFSRKNSLVFLWAQLTVCSYLFIMKRNFHNKKPWASKLGSSKGHSFFSGPQQYLSRQKFTNAERLKQKMFILSTAYFYQTAFFLHCSF